MSSTNQENLSKESNSKVCCKKILDLSIEPPHDFHSESNVLYLKSETVDDALKIINHLSLVHFPNIFAIQLYIKSDLKAFEKDKLKKAISEKINDSRPILLQIFYNDKSFTYFRERNGNFIFPPKIENQPENVIKSLKFTSRNFVQVQNCAIIDFDFEKFVEFYGLEPVKYFLYAINAQDELCVRLLMLFQPQLDYEILCEAIKCRNYEIFLSILGLFKDDELTNCVIKKIIEFTQENNRRNIFELAVQFRNVKIVETLLKLADNFKEFFNLNLILNSLNFCIQNDIFEVYYTILTFNFAYLPQNDKETLMFIIEDQRKVLTEIENLFLNIERENLDKIQSFIDEYKNYKICHHPSGVCALEHAIDLKKFNIYCYLRGNGFYASNQETLKNKIKNLEYHEKIQIRDESLKYMKKDPKAFIYILASKCDFDPLSPIKTDEIREMLLILSELYDIRPILEIAAMSEGTFHFDYKTESVHIMDPTKGETTFGVAYEAENSLFIGKDKSDLDHFATFVHELAHYVFYLIYENNSLPYCNEDEERRTLFDEIRIETYKLNQNSPSEATIAHAYSYGSIEEKNLELAVRVCHLAAKYLNQPQKFNHLEVKFEKLFNYHREKVLPDMMIQNVYRLVELNNDFGVIKSIKESPLKLQNSSKNFIINNFEEKLIILQSNVPQITLAMIFNEITNISENKLDIRTKNLFIDLEKLQQVEIKREFIVLLESSKVERIIFKCMIFEEFKKVIETLFEPQGFVKKNFQILIITDESFEVEENKQITLKISHNISDLTDESKLFLLEKPIKFNGNYFKVSDFLQTSDLITNEILSILCVNDEVLVQSGPQFEKLDIFMERFILDERNKSKPKSKNESIQKKVSLHEFVKDSLSEVIIVLSDIAGSGKTTALKKVQEILRNDFKTNWIVFVSLRDFLNEFSNGVGASFQEFISQILKYNALEKKIFELKFQSGEVKILFDAYDEISPHCKENAMLFFNLFKIEEDLRLEKMRNEHETDENLLQDSCFNLNNQIWITTRTHLEDYIASKFKITAVKLKVLEWNEQLKFLREVWANSHKDENVIVQCAEKLVSKINYIMLFRESVIGIPLIVEGLGKYFRERINENFDKEIEDLKISVVFKKIVIEASFKILRIRFPNTVDEHLNKCESIILVHQYFAFIHTFPEFIYYEDESNRHNKTILKSIKGEEFASKLGLEYDEDEWPLEEITRGGIIYYDNEGKIKFNHETYANNLLALTIFNFFKKSKFPTSFHLDLLMKVIKREEFEIVQMFIDDMLDNFELKVYKIFHSSEVVWSVIEQQNFYHILGNFSIHGQTEFLRFILEFAKRKDIKLYQQLIETEGGFFRNQTIMMTILGNIKSDEKFSKLINEVFDFYGENVFELFISRQNADGDTVLHNLMHDHVPLKKFKFFWERSKEILMDDVNKLFSLRNNDGQSFVHKCVDYYHKNLEKVQGVFELIYNESFDKESLKDFFNVDLSFDNYGKQNILIVAAEKDDQKLFDYVFQYTLRLWDEIENFKNKLLETDKYGDTILHRLASRALKVETFEILTRKIMEIFSLDEKKNFIMTKNKYNGTFLNSAFINRLPGIFDFPWAFVDEIFSPQEIMENFIYDEKLLKDGASHSWNCELKIYFEKTFQLLKGRDLKKYLENIKTHMALDFIRWSYRNSQVNLIEFIWEFLNIKISIDGAETTLKDYLLKADDFWAKDLQKFLASHNLIEALSEAYETFEATKSKENLKEWRDCEYETRMGRNCFKHLVTLKYENGQNLVHLALIEQLGKENIEFLLKIFTSFYIRDREFYYELLKEYDNYNFTPLHYAANSQSTENFKIVFDEIYFNYRLSDHTIMNLIQNDGQNIFNFLKKIPSQNLAYIFKKILSDLKKNINYTPRVKEMMEILRHANNNGESFIDFIKGDNRIGKLFLDQIMEETETEEIRQTFSNYGIIL